MFSHWCILDIFVLWNFRTMASNCLKATVRSPSLTSGPIMYLTIPWEARRAFFSMCPFSMSWVFSRKEEVAFERHFSYRTGRFQRLIQFSSVAQPCPPLCDPMDCSTPGQHHQLPEFNQTHVMPSSHLILCRPLLLQPPIPPSIKVFSNESALRMRWPKYWSFSFSIKRLLLETEEPGLTMSFLCLGSWCMTVAIPAETENAKVE